MLIPEHKIEEIRERVDLVAVVSRHVELKKAGRSYKGRCPFHQEKTASFHVTPELHRFKCFGCQAGGDAIAFVQRYLGKTFLDAVRDLAREAGVDLSAVEDPAARERQHLREVTDVALEHWKQNLWSAEKGQLARRYLRERGISEETARAFGLGWAAPAWAELSDALLARGILQWGEAAGLVQKRPRAEGYYDVFRSRLMFPIRSPEGRPIAFGGRILEEALQGQSGPAGPKYLNSRESRLYNKSDVLYGTDAAREEIRRRKSAVLVEGYFDCIGLHQAGLKHAVALCSTALTPGHLQLLGRLEAKELVLLLDGDAAGRKAVERLAGPLLAQGVGTKVALLPEGDDPDTFARREGAGGVNGLLREARSLTEHLFSTLLPRGRDSTFEEKMQGVERLKPIAAQVPVGLTRSAFFGAMSGHFGLPSAELETALRGKAAPPVRPVPKPDAAAEGRDRLRAPPEASGSPQEEARPDARRPAESGATGPRPAEKTPDRLEAFFVALALRDARMLQKDVHRVGDELGHTGLRAALGQLASGGRPEDVLEDASLPVRAALERALRELPQEESGLEPIFGQVCRELKLSRINELLSHIARETGKVAGASELTEDIRRLLEERIRLLELKRQLLEQKTKPAAGTKRSGDPV